MRNRPAGIYGMGGAVWGNIKRAIVKKKA